MTTTSVTNYNHTTRDNYNKWLNDFRTMCDKHPDRLLQIVDKGTLNRTIEAKYRSTLKEAWTMDAQRELIEEQNASAFLLLIQTINHTSTANAIHRQFTDDAKGALEWMAKRWHSTTNDERAIKLGHNRDDYARKGPNSGSLTHMGEFVEQLLKYNLELKGTIHHWGNELLTTTVMDSLQKFNKPFVTTLKHNGPTQFPHGGGDWKANFEDIWDYIQESLESDDCVEDRNNQQVDILMTKANAEKDTRIDLLQAQLLETQQMLQTFISTAQNSNTRVLATYKDWPLCTECNFKHPGGKPYPCIGKALVCGECTMDQAKEQLKKLRDPAGAANAAKARYERAHPELQSKPIVPTKQFADILMTKTSKI